jgi:hypothetical protein
VGVYTSPVASAGQEVSWEHLFDIGCKLGLPLVEAAFPKTQPVVQWVKFFVAGTKVYRTLADSNGKDVVQVGVAAAEAGLELFEALTPFYPPLSAGAGQRAWAGLLIGAADAAYAAAIDPPEEKTAVTSDGDRDASGSGGW